MTSNDWPFRNHYQLSVSGLRGDAMWNSNQSDDSSDLGDADVGDDDYNQGDDVIRYDVTDYDDPYDENAVYDEYGEYLDLEEEKSSLRLSRLSSYEPPVAASSPCDGVPMSSSQFAALSG